MVDQELIERMDGPLLFVGRQLSVVEDIFRPKLLKDRVKQGRDRSIVREISEGLERNFAHPLVFVIEHG